MLREMEVLELPLVVILPFLEEVLFCYWRRAQSQVMAVLLALPEGFPALQQTEWVRLGIAVVMVAVTELPQTLLELGEAEVPPVIRVLEATALLLEAADLRFPTARQPDPVAAAAAGELIVPTLQPVAVAALGYMVKAQMEHREDSMT